MKSLNIFLIHLTRGEFTKIYKKIFNKISQIFIKSVNENKIIFEVLQKKYKPGNMIDVGACYGSTLQPFLMSDYMVYAFEPDEKNRKILDNYKDFTNLNIDTRGVSNKVEDNVSFFRSNQSDGISGLSSFHESHFESQKINLTTLEKFCDEKDIKSIDYLKIDTEGHDLFVLQGMNSSILPRVIMCEFEDFKTTPHGYTWDDLCIFLKERDYHLLICEWQPIISYGNNHTYNKTKEYPCKLDSSDAWGNIVAFQSIDDLNSFKEKIKY